MLLVDKRGAQELQRGHLFAFGTLATREQVLDNGRMAGDGGSEQRRHLIGVGRHLGIVSEQELHDLEAAALGAVVQRRVALDALAVEVGALADQVLGDDEVALVARDHEARVAVAVGDLDVGVVLHQVLDDLDVAVEAGRAQRRAVRLGGRVDVGALGHQVLDDLEVTGGARAPQRRRALDILALEVDQARLLEIGAAILDDVLDDVVVAVAARHDEAGGAVVLARDDLLALVLGASVEVLLELARLARLGQLEDDLVRLHVLGGARESRRYGAHACNHHSIRFDSIFVLFASLLVVACSRIECLCECACLLD